MKQVLLAAATGLLLVGCASTENGTVRTTSSGTRVYGLDEQPESSVAGEGTLMPGASDGRHLPTGQFTGQERTQDVIGQRPTLPREADPRQTDYSKTPAVGTGAGSLGQADLLPGTGTISEPAQRYQALKQEAPGETSTAVGSAPGRESGSSNTRTNNVTPSVKVDEPR